MWDIDGYCKNELIGKDGGKRKGDDHNKDDKL